MEKIGTYKILKNPELILEYYYGKISIDDLIQLKKAIGKEPSYNFYFDTIIDFREAILDFRDQEMVRMINFFKKNYKPQGIRNVVYLTSTPNDVVLTTLFSEMSNTNPKLNFNPHVVSTYKAAINWLGITTLSENVLAEMIVNLKNQNNIYHM